MGTTQHSRSSGATDGGPDIALRLSEVRSRVEEAARRGGRSASGISVVAVSKTFPDAAVRAARGAGHVDFGESRAQELSRRLKADPPLGARWHFVGRLQRNKVDQVVGTATLIHSVDRMKLAHAIAERAGAAGGVQRVLVQVNVGEDPDKGGFTVEQAPGAVARIREIPGISVQGLMTIPPLGEDPRPLFARLRQLRDDLRAAFPEVVHLSMGMSGDYEVAVEEGATIVRVGSAIFGPRTSG